MSQPFVFDVTAALEDLSRGELSQLSHESRQSKEKSPKPQRDCSASVSHCARVKIYDASQGAGPPDLEVSPLSPLSPPNSGPPELTDAEQDRFEERAAIKEYDGGVPRWLAEREAWQEILISRTCGSSGA